ncbi:DnaJ family domain-containing protein [Dictyobacter arantiisoli]|uniref:DnaJ homologue subfamily C member 28 conserved domain-containing protein n=1 Tax=Dictyobacter arantiisoli TaxID=2014874 RepID=A0A5A5TA40_9CHLR|nr:DnaJ family domain-containing protein [Dictyobacter arantiisoli]GCF08380.1 hypothetical protein KDI_19440 [Dictyobacter arantiisoli]
MRFVDWRKVSQEEREAAQRLQREREAEILKRPFYGMADYHIQRAQEEGAFDNLTGTGKPFSDDILKSSGIHDLAKSILKSIGGEPVEISVRKEIERKRQQLEKRLLYFTHRLAYMQSLKPARYKSRIKSYIREVHAFEPEYQARLQEINSRILSLNIMAPTAMHMQPLSIAEYIQAYREKYYVLDDLIQ